jgi:hypothetical protein
MTIFQKIRENNFEYSGWSDSQISDMIFVHKDRHRLNYDGFLLMQKFTKFYKFPIDLPLLGKHYIGLSKSMKDPYYIGKKFLALSSESESIMISLDGSVEKFLEREFNIL